MACLFLATTLLCSPIRAQDTAAAPDSLRIGISSSLFKDVSVDDALAATKVWAEAVLRKKGYTFPAEAIFLKDKTEILEAVNQGRVDLLALPSSEYLELHGSLNVEPQLMTAARGRTGDECLLLANRQSGMETLAALRGKGILLASSPYSDICRIWLGNLVNEQGVPTLDEFFRPVTEAGKPSKAVLPVFFRRADSCLVPRGLFETMVELNPQLNAELAAVATSPRFVSSVIAVRADYKPALKKMVIDSMLQLNADANGQQILNLFKIDRFVPFDGSLLETAKQELAKNVRLRKQFGKLTTATAAAIP